MRWHMLTWNFVFQENGVTTRYDITRITSPRGYSQYRLRNTQSSAFHGFFNTGAAAVNHMRQIQHKG